MSRIRKVKVTQSVSGLPQKKSRNKAVIFTIVLAGLMIMSVFGIVIYGFSNAQSSITYNKYAFKQTAGGWSTKIDGATVEFNHPPPSVADLAIDPKITESILSSRMLYLVADPDAQEIINFEGARFQYAQLFPRFFNIYTVNAISKESQLYKQPVITCANATERVPVLYFSDGNETAITMNESCIVFTSNAQTTVALKDRLLFALFKIIQ
ncbi:hypothetical protein HY772_02630 [Candidatus Woesearchaeota archaeon]|nr:hypothetical protein [Candidatus Woesearchaeota archaeon]